MPVKETLTSRLMVIGALGLIFAGVTGLILSVPSSESKFLGGCLLGVGAIQIALHRKFGQQTFDWVQTMPAFVANFWRRLGSDGIQFLYLSIGIILVAGGTFVLVRSFSTP
jgi:hypothetical protein